MSDRGGHEALDIAACFAERFDLQHVPENPEAHQKGGDRRRPDTSMILKISAQRPDDFLQNELPKHRRGRRTGKRADDNVERAYLNLGMVTIARKELPCEMNILVFSLLHKKAVGFDGFPQSCGKKLLLGTETSVHIGDIDPGISRDVAQAGIFIRMPREPPYRRIQNALLRR